MLILGALVGIIFLCYIATSLALFAGTYCKLSASPFPEANTGKWPFLSILVAARNEEKYLPGCLDSLLQCEYPRDRFEIVVMNDRSTDGTPALLAAYTHRHAQIRSIFISEVRPGMSGKASALTQGAAHARGEILLFTDADCLVPPTWMRHMVDCFSPATGLVGGFALLSPPPWAQHFLKEERDAFFAKLQALDWIYLLTIGAGAAGWGHPVSIIGNNFGVRREAYEQIGGHAQLGFSIVEDFALMHKIARAQNWRVRFAVAAQAAVFSYPARNWREFFEQRQRWTAGGKEFGGFAKYLILLALCCHMAIVVAAFHSLSLFAFGCLVMLLMDFLLLWRGTAVLRVRHLLWYVLPFRIYFLIYNLALAPFFFFPASVRWKGRRYRQGARGLQMEEELAQR